MLVDPRRVHITLGVMTLSSKTETQADSSAEPESKTLPDALELLRFLAPKLAEISLGQPVQVSLDRVGILKKSKGTKAGVLWIGPSSTRENTKLQDICGTTLPGSLFSASLRNTACPRSRSSSIPRGWFHRRYSTFEGIYTTYFLVYRLSLRLSSCIAHLSTHPI